VRNPELLQQSLTAMQQSFSGAVNDSMDLIKQLQRRMGR
jgi:hypothetical protein